MKLTLQLVVQITHSLLQIITKFVGAKGQQQLTAINETYSAVSCSNHSLITANYHEIRWSNKDNNN